MAGRKKESYHPFPNAKVWRVLNPLCTIRDASSLRFSAILGRKKGGKRTYRLTIVSKYVLAYVLVSSPHRM